MVYPPQMRVLSALNGQLIIDKSKKPDTNRIRNLINIFCSRNSIHGINNFLRESCALYEQFIWLLVLAFTVIGMIYVSLILSQRYTEGKFETVVDSTMVPVYEIIFPTITICNHNRLNWKRLEAAKERFIPRERDPVKVELFTRFIAAFDGFAFGKFDSFANVSGEPLSVLDGVNFTNVFAFMTWTCEEMLEECKWRNEKMNCCEVFHQQKSELGPCFSFNGVQDAVTRERERTDPFYPLRNSNYGPGSALEVKVMIRPEDHIPNSTRRKGIEVMVHETPVWQKDDFFVPWNTETSVEIDPVIYFYDNDTRSISSSLRKCVFDVSITSPWQRVLDNWQLFPDFAAQSIQIRTMVLLKDERNSDDFKSVPGYVYMLENCYSQCRQEHLMRYCNCTLDLLYPPGDFPPCQASDFQCIYENRDKFRYTKRKGEEKYVFNRHEGMTCKCFRNCHSLNYIAEVRPSYLPTSILGNLSFVYVDAHYRFDSIMVYRTGLVFGWVDLMVSFGGIAGLFLGCSLISAAEILYFVGIDIPRFVYRHVKDNWQERTQKSVGLQLWANAIRHHRVKDQRLYNHQENVFRVENVVHRSRY